MEGHRWADENDLKIVGKYLINVRTGEYWLGILKGGVRGYSLYLHERVELDWYNHQRLNPFDAEQQVSSYPKAFTYVTL